MANSTFRQFFYTKHMAPVLIDCNFAIGASGAVGTVAGPGVQSVTRLAAGFYKVRFQDNYNRFYGFEGMVKSDNGVGVAAGSLSPGSVYTILTLGTTTTAQWVTAGVPVGITPAIGVTFLCAATSGGTGTAALATASGVYSLEVVGEPNTTMAPAGVGNMGGYVVVRCVGPTATADTAQISVDPADGSKLWLQFLLSNSSVTVQGE